MEWHSLRCRFAVRGCGSVIQTLLRKLYSELNFDDYMKFMMDLYNKGNPDLAFLYDKVSYDTFMLAYKMQELINNGKITTHTVVLK